MIARKIQNVPPKNEVDFLIDGGIALHPIEVKSGKAAASDWFDGIEKWKNSPTNVPDREYLFTEAQKHVPAEDLPS